MHKRTGPMGQRKIEYGNNGTGLYVNREACVRANSGRVFTRGCTHCVCRQNGSVSCVPIVPCNTKAPRHISANNILADRILVDRFAREQTFGSFSECVQTHGGHQSFKADCNTCSCTETGAVVCTLKACIDESHHHKPDTNSSYAKCVKDNGGSTFKQKCNVCMCLQDGNIACTKKLCLS
ncbi:hypothetical protein H4S00_004159 [Coemansia sp. D1744]|nr:hypothetical protein H4S00_004159 [Coemansia sp. D1744]